MPFEDYLEKRFPDSRRKAYYYLMAIHENLPRQMCRELKQMGWTKARELVKVARAEGERFDCAPWVHKASAMPREEFKREVDRFLTGRESEPWDLLYFKVYKSQLAVIERALETAGLMLGTDKSRGYCLEMICADFLAGANIEEQSRGFSAFFAARLRTLAARAAKPLPARDCGYAVSGLRPKQPRIRLNPEPYKALCKQVLIRDSWRCQNCGTSENLQVHHVRSRSKLGHDSLESLITLCAKCHEALHRGPRSLDC